MVHCYPFDPKILKRKFVFSWVFHYATPCGIKHLLSTWNLSNNFEAVILKRFSFSLRSFIYSRKIKKNILCIMYCTYKLFMCYWNFRNCTGTKPNEKFHQKHHKYGLRVEFLLYIIEYRINKNKSNSIASYQSLWTWINADVIRFTSRKERTKWYRLNVRIWFLYQKLILWVCFDHSPKKPNSPHKNLFLAFIKRRGKKKEKSCITLCFVVKLEK